MNRRGFLHRSSLTLAGVAATTHLDALAQAAAQSPGRDASLPEPTPSKLPRWRGFNLLEKFSKRANGNPPLSEEDFAWTAEWGFNFLRLPMSYLCWTAPGDWRRLEEPERLHIDQAVEFGRQYGVHVNLNFHRAPGYCVNPPAEPKDLWTDDDALEVCALHWAAFARRYKGIPNRRLSFDLLNEPKDLTEDAYFRVADRLVKAIRSEDPDRLIIADGLRWGNRPAHRLIPLRVGQSTRGYQPMRVSHHKASWVGGQNWEEPTWPLRLKEGDVWDRDRLRREQIEPWKALAAQGVGVHVGEWGAFNVTPHPVALAWMRDYLDLWKEVGWGWALWNLRGSFGIVDSGRKDVAYEPFRGHQLDRAMLELLRAG
ncbi:MAG TPA: cellulase family glycosylhydrolase [Verrucomicrobiota bacterium]|nr:cellulase family glycosylhydrolase [Verrucomicrobiota bacterium]HNU50393.1 cellulase family glycosylhydrolase [Verrucomicrobiota bacterium]